MAPDNLAIRARAGVHLPLFDCPLPPWWKYRLRDSKPQNDKIFEKTAGRSKKSARLGTLATNK
jgi:hypothetical protein